METAIVQGFGFRVQGKGVSWKRRSKLVYRVISSNWSCVFLGSHLRFLIKSVQGICINKRNKLIHRKLDCKRLRDFQVWFGPQHGKDVFILGLRT